MNDESFAELLESVREGGAILRGETAPSRSFEALALERGEAPEKVAAARLQKSFLSDEERDDLEDALDLAAMERASLENDPSERKTLDDLRATLAERRK